MAGRKPSDKLTGQDKVDMRNRLVDVHGFTTGQASSIVNANDNADMLNKVIERCRTFKKAGS